MLIRFKQSTIIIKLINDDYSLCGNIVELFSLILLCYDHIVVLIFLKHLSHNIQIARPKKTSYEMLIVNVIVKCKSESNFSFNLIISI